MSRLYFLIIFFFGASAFAQNKDHSVWFYGEGNIVWQGKNEIQIPSNTGTRFSIADAERGGNFTGRIYFGYRFNNAHEFRALYAPLTINAEGTFSQDINFDNQVFAAGTPINLKYKFNSYRLTYRYKFVDNQKWQLRAGATAKIRDAEVRLSQGETLKSNKNVGFVPLAHLSVEYMISSVWSFVFDADALVSPYGRAEDIALLAKYRLNDRTHILAGYRTVEGGTDGTNSDVYNFAWLHYAALGLSYEF